MFEFVLLFYENLSRAGRQNASTATIITVIVVIFVANHIAFGDNFELTMKKYQWEEQWRYFSRIWRRT